MFYHSIGFVFSHSHGIVGGFPSSSAGKMRAKMVESFEKAEEPVYLNSSRISQEALVEYLGNTTFCLCPRGHHIVTPRLFEAIWSVSHDFDIHPFILLFSSFFFRFGCIPVILSDSYLPPFSCFFPWRSFSVTIPESSSYLTYETLKQISPQQQRDMRQRLFEIRNYFSYFSSRKDAETAFHMVLLEYWLKQAVC
jgi:xylogalacturonan beta-1,3-xylosyltransferase